jgi:RNA polymerase sigma factor (sigma-70 family)
LEVVISNTLLQRCQDDDSRAQSELYKLLYGSLIGLCWRYSTDNEQAVEYMNLGFVRILLNIKRYKKDVPFEMWARRVMINTIINEFKKNKNWNEKSVRGQDLRMVEERDDFGLSEHQSEMLEIIKQKSIMLPPMTLKVFNLYAIDGYSHNEISNLLGISEGTSAWHFSEAKKRIRQMIGISRPVKENGQ